MCERIKKYLRELKYSSVCCNLYSTMNVCNSVKGRRHNKVIHDGALLKNVKIFIHGSGNRIQISRGCILRNCRFDIYGNDGVVIIDKNCQCNNMSFWLEDDGSYIKIGEGSTFGKTHLAAIEGTGITIGNDCMFSSDIVIQTGDAHSIIDEMKERINPSKDICIRNHVWVGKNVMCEKGVNIPSNSIIGAGSIVTDRLFEEEGVIVAGNPAKVLKNNINWKRERI